MIFKISRLILLILLLLISVIAIRKSNIKRKRLSTIILSLLSFALVLISYWYPVENLFITFSTPEQAFNYSAIGKIESIEYGKDSCFIVYKDNINSYSNLMLPKKGNGYQLPNEFDCKRVNSVLSRYSSVDIYKFRKTNDLYIIGLTTSNSQDTKISDSCNSDFSYSVKAIDKTDDKSIIYYAYIKDYSDYYVVFNGNKIEVT